MKVIEGNTLHGSDIFLLACADNLFGSCQRSQGHVDNYQYHLNTAQLSELYGVISRLVTDGYKWRHRHTQCVLCEALLRYRHGSMIGGTPSLCIKSNLHEDRFKAELTNSSQLSVQRMSTNVKVSPHQKYYGAFGEFENFMQGLQADDLFALKKFLLKDSFYKQPESATTVPGVTSPSGIGNDLQGSVVSFWL